MALWIETQEAIRKKERIALQRDQKSEFAQRPWTDN